MKRLLIALAVMLTLTAISGPAVTARADTIPWGGRLGFSIDPDQLVLGGHAWVAEPMRGWFVQPTLEFGFFDGLTTVAINGDFLYSFPELESEEWAWYTGAGLGYANYSANGNSNTEFGINLLGGVNRKLANDHRVGAELRIGLFDLPDVKIVGVYTLW